MKALWHLTFTGGWPSHRGLPKDNLPEVAFCGRSNSGKSSLLNAACGSKSLARVSRTPGRTRALNCFDIRRHSAAHSTARLVDLPGYGFARVSRKQAGELSRLLSEYLSERRNLCLLMLVVDVRRGLRDIDREFLELAGDRQLVIALSKCDKVSRQQAAQARQKIAAELTGAEVVATSAAKNMGIEPLVRALDTRLASEA